MHTDTNAPASAGRTITRVTQADAVVIAAHVELLATIGKLPPYAAQYSGDAENLVAAAAHLRTMLHAVSNYTAAVMWHIGDRLVADRVANLDDFPAGVLAAHAVASGDLIRSVDRAVDHARGVYQPQ